MLSPSYKRNPQTKRLVQKVIQLVVIKAHQKLRANGHFPATTTMPARAKDITNTIGYFVAKDMMLISTTGGVGFKQLICVLEPRYVIPHRKTFTEKTIPAMYNRIVLGHLFPQPLVLL